MFSINMRRILRCISLLIVAAGVFLLSSTALAASFKHILIINSYHRGYPFSDAELEGVDHALSLSEFAIETHTEYMDAKRYLDEPAFRLFFEVLQHKYRTLRPDVIIALDNDALNFILKSRDELFPGVPVVFAGINDFKESTLAGQTGITGVVEGADYKGTVESARSLFPQLKNIILLTDGTTTGIAHKDAARAALAPLSDVMSFEELSLSDMSMEDLLARLKTLPQDTAILLLSHFVDKTGHVFSANESETLITGASPVPVFVVTDFRVGFGAIGGKVISSSLQGENAGKYALRVLRGEPIETIGVLKEPLNIYMFDYRVMERFGVALESLPRGSVIRNNPDSLYGRLHTSLITLALVVLLLTLIIGILGVNIRRRVRAEKALRKSEAKYREVLEAAHEGILALDADFNVVFVNRRLAELLGYQPNEMVGKSVVLFIHPDEVPDHMRRVDDRKKGKGGYYERRFLRKDKSILVMQVSATPLFDDEGVFCGALTMGTDVTEQRKIEEALEHAHSLLLAALEQTPAAIIIADADSGSIKLMNRAAEDMYLESRESFFSRSPFLSGNTTWKCYHLDGSLLPHDEMPLSRALRGEPTHNVELRLLRKDGTERWVLGNSSPVLTTGGKIIAGVSVFTDVTLQRQLQSEIHRSAKLESLGILAGGIAHDFNNLLSAIAGNAALAKLIISGTQAARAERCLSEVEKAAMRARDLTQQLLTFSRGGAPMSAIVDVGPMLKEAASFALTGSRNSYEIEFSELWPAFVDPGQITQVIHNLVLNAEQSMVETGVIRISAENFEVQPGDHIPLVEGPYIRISVRDSGRGIPPDILPKIFDPFFTTKPQGSGLGLTSAYSIIKAHGGHITVASVPGQGSVFTFYIPGRPGTMASETASAAIERSSKALNILVMDDEQMIRDLLEDALKRFGHSVTLVPDGKAALDAFSIAAVNTRPFDIVILDLTVPGGMGGKEALEKLKEEHPGVVAVASSGYATDPIMGNYEDYGFAARLAKPYRLSDLKELLARLAPRDGSA